MPEIHTPHPEPEPPAGPPPAEPPPAGSLLADSSLSAASALGRAAEIEVRVTPGDPSRLHVSWCDGPTTLSMIRLYQHAVGPLDYHSLRPEGAASGATGGATAVHDRDGRVLLFQRAFTDHALAVAVLDWLAEVDATADLAELTGTSDVVATTAVHAAYAAHEHPEQAGDPTHTRAAVLLERGWPYRGAMYALNTQLRHGGLAAVHRWLDTPKTGR